MLFHIRTALRRIAAVVVVAFPRIMRDSAAALAEKAGRVLFLCRTGRRSLMKRRESQRPKVEGRWLTPEEGDLVDALACVIVPSSEDVPGASDMDVMGAPALRQIDSLLAARRASHLVYARGLIAVDEMAQAVHGRRFVDLAADKKLEIVSSIESLHRRRVDPSRNALQQRLLRKLAHLWGMWRGWSAAADLFPMIVSDTLKVFYSSEVAWLWLQYDGPPMPLGYESLEIPRKSKRAVPLSAPSTTPRKSAAAVDTADVVVVGSGAGGAVVAKELAEAGLSVIVIEAGRRFVPLADYLTDRADFEIRAKGVFNPTDERRDVYTTPGQQGFSYNRVKGVGGSTLHYAAMSPRLHETDFATRSTDGVADDWPISYADLEPYYTRVELELGVSGPDGANPFEPPRSRPYPTPAHPFNLASQAIKKGADRLGLHLVREPLALPSRDWQGRSACVGAGTCHLGCLISAKSSMDVTYVRKAEATGRVHIRTESMAREIEVDGSGKARAVVYIDKDGRNRRASGRAVVVAGNAVETPRLLLMSTSNRFPDGLANSSGLVGRNFMEHLGVWAYGLFDQRIDPWRGTPSGGIIQDNYATNRQNGFARGWTVLVSANSHWPYTVASRIAGWGEEHKKYVERMFGHYTCVATIGEQLPDQRNRVILDPAEKDLYGLPAPRLINQARDNDLAMIKKMSTVLTELLEASGASEIWGNEYSPGMTSHYLGTCRMGRDPKSSVVDAWGRAHDVPNLYIADSSVFVTGGAANPALTVSALALRTSEAIVAAFRRNEL
ncbi:MAG: GMC oxidoreductase [Gammaproteobacteria bacterium]|nr:GMC oxidoreductase [Gammaproteobacteria bacterium]